MPRQNRPAARDNRLQTTRKRTDRSYLRPTPGAPSTATEEVEAEATGEPDAVADVVVAAAPPAAVVARVPSGMRAIQQQGVRKRRDVDLRELAVSDTRQALHDLRRIAVLIVMVTVALVVLTIVLR